MDEITYRPINMKKVSAFLDELAMSFPESDERREKLHICSVCITTLDCAVEYLSKHQVVAVIPESMLDEKPKPWEGEKDNG